MSLSSSLVAYVIKRILQAIPALLAVIILCFTLIHLAPGDPVYIMVGSTGAPRELIELLTKEFGLDKPFPEQLGIYIIRVLQGDFGYSYYHHKPVMSLITERAGATLLLVFTSVIFAVALGILLGVMSAIKHRSLLDNFIAVASLAGFSTPTFFFGMILLLVFSLYLGWLPVGGVRTLTVDLRGIDAFVDLLRHLTLPTVTLGVYYLAIITRLTRASMLEVLRLDYIIFARSKGISERRVICRHALKNALLPVVTIIGVSIGAMLTGAVLTETVFSWPGLGRLLWDSVFNLDYPVIMGLFIVSATSVIIISLIVDILYAFIDPRVKYR